MRGRTVGSLIGAVFGLIYVEVNSSPLPGAAQWPLQALGILAFGGVVAAVLRRSKRADSRAPDGPASRGQAFGRAYWLVVLAEAVALFGGLRLLSGPLDMAPKAGVTWVSVVVGVHFFALAVVFGQRFFHLLGAAIAVCGVVGLGLVLAGVGAASVSLVGGVLPGLVLLGFAWWGASHQHTPRSKVETAEALAASAT